jgi:adenylate cyclase
LPFDNMNGDPTQEYFSDGLTEDLITDLSRISGLFVIARNSVFTYKGTPVLVQQIASDLGVNYVLEGSVRKSGTRIRINAQLVDAATGRHLWAERYDRELTEVFALQDEVVQKIVSALAVELTPDEAQRLSQAAKADPEIYDLMLQGRERFVTFTREGNAAARAIFERVIAMDPSNARAHARLAFTHAQDVIRGWTGSPKAAINRALDAGRVALALDDTLPQVHFVLANVRMAQRQPAAALAAAQRAVELDPNYADGHAAIAQALNWAGRPQEAMEKIDKALRLNPRHPFIYSYILGHANFVADRFDSAASALETVLERNPDFVHGHIYLAASYGHLGRTDDAAWEIEELQLLHPEFSLERARQSALYQNRTDLERFIEGLRKAGLSE